MSSNMKKKLLVLWFVFASIDFGIMVAKASFFSLAVCSIVSVIVGLFLFQFCSTYLFPRNPIVRIIDLFLDIAIIMECYGVFYNSWIPSSRVHRILGLISSNESLLLRIISLLMAFFAIPFIHFAVSFTVGCVVKSLNIIKWKELLAVKTISLKCILKSAGISILNIVIAAFCGFLLLIAVFQLPMDNILRNVEKSASVIEEEGDYPILSPWCTSQLDNFTDSVILIEASDITEDSAVMKALMVYRGGIEGEGNPASIIVEHFIKGKDYTDSIAYARYWHGYLVFFKPLLEIMDYGTIRIVNGIIQILLCFSVCMLLWKNSLKYCILPYLLFYLMMMPIALAKSLQYSSCYYVISVGMIALLLFASKKREFYTWLIFLNIGILTVYFDFLTYPLATYGIPAALLLVLSREDETEMKLKIMIKNGIAWCVGFGGMWASKWVLTAIFTDYDVFRDAFSAFSNRTSHTTWDGNSYSILKCIAQNYKAFLKTPITALIFVFVSFFILYILKKKNINYPKIMSLYIILALAPVIWYCFAVNHSATHYYFTNKCCSISIISILFGLAECYISANKKPNNEKGRTKQWIK